MSVLPALSSIPLGIKNILDILAKLIHVLPVIFKKYLNNAA